MTIISLISALTVDHVIGIKNIIPWYLPADMKWFKYHTLYKPIIMGRKTFESMGKQPLLNRFNIVLSHNLLNYCSNGVVVVDDPNKALFLIKDDVYNEVMIIGGGSVYNVFLPYARRLYLTYVHSIIKINGDTWFPNYDINEWKLVFDSRYNIREYFCHYLNFKIFERF